MEKGQDLKKKKKEGEEEEEEEEEEEPQPEPIVEEEPTAATPTAATTPGTTTEPMEEGEKSKPKLKLPTAWPPNRTLEAHLKSIFDAILKMSNASQREKQKMQKQYLFFLCAAHNLRHEKKEAKRRQREERENAWTKREQNDFRITLLAYGAGNWDRMRQRAGLRKTNEQIDVSNHLFRVIHIFLRNTVVG